MKMNELTKVCQHAEGLQELRGADLCEFDRGTRGVRGRIEEGEQAGEDDQYL